MTGYRPLVAHHSPLPPSRNGIADYAARVIEALKPHYRQMVVHYNDDALPLDAAPAVLATPVGLPLYQIGNNWQHTDVMREALRVPGVVILHDLQLYYLYESLGYPKAEVQALMGRSNPSLGALSLDALFDKRPTTKWPYLLCNMLPDLIARSRAVVVHSHYAKRFIVRHLGETVEDKLSVIPHFAIAAAPRDAASLRKSYGYGDDVALVVTAGFAARSKGFEILAEAVASLSAQGQPIQWIHAGGATHGDMNLHDIAARHPAIAGRFIATGYLGEDALDDHVAMADIVVNLRFPTVGESSGSLARALAAGACVIVSDTGSYGEIPGDCVVHLPAQADAHALSTVLAGLIDDAELRHRIGDAALNYAQTELALERYGAMLASVINHAASVKVSASTSSSMKGGIQWFDTATLEGMAALAEYQTHLGDGDEELIYSDQPQGYPAGAYIGVRRP